MIVFSDRKSPLNSRGALAQARSSGALDALVLLGQIEAGAVDAGVSAQTSTALRSSMEASAAWYLGYHERPVVPDLELPPQVRVGVPEGFAWYALYPEQYACAARKFVAEERPERCCVLGIRSIGTTLSAVVSAAIRHAGIKARSDTVRPNGHPFSRAWTPPEEVDTRAHWLIVDEGPGISGSTFASVAEGLSQAGVPDDQIVFFPSWDPDPCQLLADTAKRRWRRHRRYVASFEDLKIVPNCAEDWSGGNWRKYQDAGAIPVQPQWERRKYRVGDSLWKFVGLGALADARVQKARQLAAAGFGPDVQGVEGGFLLLKYVEGRPQQGSIDLQRLREYLSFTSTLTAHKRGATTAELLEMIRVNAEEAGLAAPEVCEPESTGVVQVDGRQLPHEWIAAANSFVKTDGYDHFDDHFLPGCQPIEWDIAGSMVEFRLSAPALPCRDLEFWTAAYAAYRLGCVSMGGADFEGMKEHYARWLSAPTIARLRSIT